MDFSRSIFKRRFRLFIKMKYKQPNKRSKNKVHKIANIQNIASSWNKIKKNYQNILIGHYLDHIFKPLASIRLDMYSFNYIKEDINSNKNIKDIVKCANL